MQFVCSVPSSISNANTQIMRNRIRFHLNLVSEYLNSEILFCFHHVHRSPFYSCICVSVNVSLSLSLSIELKFFFTSFIPLSLTLSFTKFIHLLISTKCFSFLIFSSLERCVVANAIRYE